MTLNLPAHFLQSVAPRVSGTHGARQSAILTAIEPIYQDTLIAFGIDNDYRAAYFTGQCCHESDAFCTTEEYASGEDYEGRTDLGDTHDGDGVLFKGRGLIQLTGRTNYAEFGPLIGMDLIAHPEAAADPVVSLKIACLFWQRKGLSPLADLDDLSGITRKINGGLNGLAQRQGYTDKAFEALGYSIS